MITLAQLTEMLNMQEQLEVRIDGPDWRNKGHDYGLCIHMECAEIIDHLGWKHWKNIEQEPNWDAVAMELVDVWHFFLAHTLTSGLAPDILFDVMTMASDDVKDVEQDMITCCLGMGYSMISNQVFPLQNFIVAMDHASMTMDDLYRMYIGKNVLNWFRQDHGYKEGLYMKNWAGHEDNEHLLEITNQLGDNFNSVELVKCLTARYALAGH
jgi:hypothetical protein